MKTEFSHRIIGFTNNAVREIVNNNVARCIKRSKTPGLDKRKFKKPGALEHNKTA